MKHSQLMWFWLIIICSMLSVVSFPGIAISQTLSSHHVSDTSVSRIPSPSDTVVVSRFLGFPLWLMGSLSIDAAEPSGIGEDMDPWAYDFKFGATWYNSVFIFTMHGTHGYYQGDSFESHRYDYAILYGNSERTSLSFIFACVGLSFVDYRTHGNVIPGSAETPDGYIYQVVNGSAFGIAVMGDIYFTPIPYWGLVGIGVYGNVSKNESYFSLDFTFPLEFNIPVWFVK